MQFEFDFDTRLIALVALIAIVCASVYCCHHRRDRHEFGAPAAAAQTSTV